MALDFGLGDNELFKAKPVPLTAEQRAKLK
jgi:hypothetical protein